MLKLSTNYNNLIYLSTNFDHDPFNNFRAPDTDILTINVDGKNVSSLVAKYYRDYYFDIDFITYKLSVGRISTHPNFAHISDRTPLYIYWIREKYIYLRTELIADVAFLIIQIFLRA